MTATEKMVYDTTRTIFDDFQPLVETSTATSIYVKWSLAKNVTPYVHGFQVHYQKLASTYVQYSNMLPPNTEGYNILNLVADTYYKVCVVLYRNDTSSKVHQCVDANTSNWHIPVSIGSSIGAILALSIIVLVVLLARCPSLIRKQRQVASDSSKYDSMSSHFPEDHYEMSDTTVHGHEHEEELLSEHKVHVHSFDDGMTTHEKIFERKYRPATDPLCNGNRNHVLPHSGSLRSHGERGPVHHHHRAHHHSHMLQTMRTHHQSLMLEHHPIPQLTHASSLDEQSSIKDYSV